MGDYVTLKIPVELVQRMDFVIKNRLCGYRSRAEIASEGIRIILSGVINHQQNLKENDGGGNSGDKVQSI